MVKVRQANGLSCCERQIRAKAGCRVRGFATALQIGMKKASLKEMLSEKSAYLLA
jgi:hypothetical protein